MNSIKGKILGFITFIVLIFNKADAQWFADNFDGIAVNEGFWNVILPFPQSQIVQSSGVLASTGRGTLGTVSGFNAPYVLSGSVRMNDGQEHFQITVRTDMSTSTATGLSSFYVLTGIEVVFSVDGGQISIQKIDASNPNPPILAQTNFSFSTGQFYRFKIIDTGLNVTVLINGAKMLSADTTFNTGNKIGFQSREFNYTSSSLNYIQIAPLLLNTLYSDQLNRQGNIPLGFLTETNTIYFIQASPNLTTWTNYDGPFLGNGNYFYGNYSTTTQIQNFYRLEAFKLESWQ